MMLCPNGYLSNGGGWLDEVPSSEVKCTLGGPFSGECDTKPYRLANMGENEMKCPLGAPVCETTWKLVTVVLNKVSLTLGLCACGSPEGFFAFVAVLNSVGHW